MAYDVIIIGAGPGGLACAAKTAALGLKTLVLERKKILGSKVCAGGITWNGLLARVSQDTPERQFCQQHIFTRFQKVCVSSATPIIATVNRQKLGSEMAQKASRAGASIRTNCQVESFDNTHLTLVHADSKIRERLSYTFLVGADGSSSLVRKKLGLPFNDLGVGITYQLPGNYPEMQWHIDTSLFANGYAWIFPHRETASIGAYVDAKQMKARILKTNLLKWGDTFGYPLRQHKPSAEWINFDYRGWQFGNVFLVGDAAGLASGLTGEGIYSAIISGETVGNYIANKNSDMRPLQQLLKNHALHRRMLALSGQNRTLATFLSEAIVFCLGKKIANFSSVEMAH